MELEALFLQINELEETNRTERARLQEEQSLHQTTKKELEKSTYNWRKWHLLTFLALSSVSELKTENDKLRLRITSLETSYESSEKVISQLKKALKDAKEGRSFSPSK
jgi:hypothetical protein